MGVFQTDLGTPVGYEEWLIGDEHQYRLAEYDGGEVVELDSYEMTVLDRITDEVLPAIFRKEFSNFSSRTALAIYVKNEKIEQRWGNL